jgi:ubiquinone biosynthesis O-methyltransferase
VRKFARLAAQWWDPRGPMAPLHAMNPARLGFVRSHLCQIFGRDPLNPRPLEGLTVLDVGCGAGIATEPLRRMGARALGVDAAAENVEAARRHAASDPALEGIEYTHGSAEELARAGRVFDAVVSLEVVEHVLHPREFVATLATLLKPGGALFMSTLNRTPASYAVAIVGAEMLAGVLPRGTHDWLKFLTPLELGDMMRAAELRERDATGLVFDPLRWEWRLAPSFLHVNYIMCATKP